MLGGGRLRDFLFHSESHPFSVFVVPVSAGHWYGMHPFKKQSGQLLSARGHHDDIPARG